MYARARGRARAGFGRLDIGSAGTAGSARPADGQPTERAPGSQRRSRRRRPRGREARSSATREETLDHQPAATWANVGRLPTCQSRPALGTSVQLRRRAARGNRPHFEHSLF
jgi:hypothetical protein